MNNSKQNWIIYAISIVLVLAISIQTIEFINTPKREIPALIAEGWTAPSLFTDRSVQGEERALVIYGEELIANTSKYLGPNGSVAHVTNGMNCQNCHLNAGRKTWGNNYGAVAANYPKFRDRSGSIETVYKRVTDCMERSLNGSALDSNSREIKAMIAYIKWVGHGVEKDSVPNTLHITGSTDSGLVMSMEHTSLPIQGVQFHPESVLTEHGHQMLANWLVMCGDKGAREKAVGLSPVVNR